MNIIEDEQNCNNCNIDMK